MNDLSENRKSWRDEWWTKPQTLDYFDISERTLYRWRAKHHIRTARLTRRHPIMFNADDLKTAEADENARNPVT